MLILNNENRVVILRSAFTNASDYLSEDKKIVLHPGANEVPNQKWDSFKDHPGVKSFIDIGTIEPREKGFESVRQMSVREAIDLAKITVSKPALEKMLRDDRPAVKDAVKKQMESLETKAA